VSARVVSIAGHRSGLSVVEALGIIERSDWWSISRRGCSASLFAYTERGRRGLTVRVRRKKGETLAGLILRCAASLEERRKRLVS